MTLLDLMEYDAACALMEYREGWLGDSIGQADAYHFEEKTRDKRIVHFLDGSRLEGYGDGLNIWTIVHPDGRVLSDG